jgi:hypothetical protein
LAKKSSVSVEDASTPYVFPVGTFVEFAEKNRVHVGKIDQQEQKTKGGARYVVTDGEGHHYNIADKEVHFAIHPPNSPAIADKLFDEFCAAQKASEEDLQAQLQISPEILELAWEESLEAADSESGDGVITPSKLVEIIHSHTASVIEKYVAWKFLQTDLARIFFRDIKEHGRITSFKAKARKAVEATKQTFCSAHEDSDLCLV